MNQPTHPQLRTLPSVNVVLEHPTISDVQAEHGRAKVLTWVRAEIAQFREELLRSTDPDTAQNGDRDSQLETIVDRVSQRGKQRHRVRIGRVINATGIILHTNLGRAPLSDLARSALTDVAGAGNIEMDLDSGERRYRGHQLHSMWQSLTGCDDAFIVNNNAAATLLTLSALCTGKEVIISRGQLIEIGGSFRLPEIFEQSGVIMREVGTTNRTHVSDYERVIGPDTAAIMRVHPSNYRVIGFADTPEIEPLAALAHDHNLIAIDDIGSGALVDVTKFGLPAEPTFQESLEDGADVVLGSGDKLLGGPQCGIMLGRSEHIGRLRQHPLARTFRVDKLTLGAMSATLDSYLRDVAETEIPTLQMLATTVEQLEQRARSLESGLQEVKQLRVEVERAKSPVGGGSVPGADLPTAVLSLQHEIFSADDFAHRLRLGTIRIVSRIQHERVIIDLRSVEPSDDSRIKLALRLAAGQN